MSTFTSTDTGALPPRYNHSFQDRVLARTVAAAPPRYSVIYGDPQEIVPSGSKPTEHEFTLRSGVLMTGKPWLALKVLTRPSTLTHKYPRIFGGEDIAGTVEIKLDQPMNITSITLYLRGRMRSGYVDQVYPFIEVAHPVWSKDAGDPMNPGKKFDGKFSGDYSLPFSFPFPTEVDIKPRTGGKSRQSVVPTVVSSPQTFLERHIHANIDYELVLQLTHGILRSDSKLKATVVYIPEVMPPPPSEMRQAAYVGGARSLAGPVRDPNGWVKVPAVSTHGSVQNREVTMEYQLYLAQPLSYTRGTVIPCYMAMRSLDIAALTILADPKVQRVRLQRSITFFEDPIRGVEQALLQGKDPKTVEDTLEVGLAVWWTPFKDETPGDHIRWLEGEIHLEKDLPPSSDFLPFKISYSVQILRPDAAIFLPSTRGEQQQTGSGQARSVLLSHPVTIATLNADGPIPTAFTHKPRTRRQSSANQRPTGEDSRMALYGKWTSARTDDFDLAN